MPKAKASMAPNDPLTPEEKARRAAQKLKSKEPPTPEEEARRAAQKLQRQRALERQAAGALPKKELKRKRAAGEPLPKLPKKKKEHEREKFLASDAKNEEARPMHDLVIVPIFWRNVPGQEEAMVKEAQRVKAVLQKLGGLDVWVDRTHKRTPGQKLNFWESQGVRWRVEIGPKEAVRHRCVLSHQRGVAGDYSTVTKLTNVSTVKRAQLLGKLRTGLALVKIPESALTAVADDSLGDQKQAVMADENLKCMLKPSQEAIEAAQRPWADDGEGTPPWENQSTKEAPTTVSAKGSAAAPAATTNAAPEVPRVLNAKERRAQRRTEEATAAKAPKAVVF